MATRLMDAYACSQEVNNELKALQKENSELWAPEALYYAGIVRRAVNPYHVVELQTWLKVRIISHRSRYLSNPFRSTVSQGAACGDGSDGSSLPSTH